MRHPQRLAAHPLRRFGQPRRRLRAGLVQLLFAVAGLGLGLLLPRITLAPTVASSRVTETLIGVGFGVLGLVSIIFSLLFLVVQWACSSLSPRLNLFRDDPIVWRTSGLAGAARDHAAALTGPGAAAAAPGTARRLRAAVPGPHGGRPARRPHQMPSVTWLVQSTADRQDAVDSSQLLAFWMKASGTALLAVERCSLVRVCMAAQGSRSAHGGDRA